MELIRLSPRSRALFEDAFSLYTEAFPHEERRDPPEQLRVLHKEDYHFDLLTQDDQLLGIVLYWQTPQFLYLEHLSTLPSMRNQGLGAAALDLLKEKGLPIILEIEPPENELTKRRFGFYQRNGFVMTDHFHIQPKYHAGDEDLQLKILSWPHAVTAEEYACFKAYLDREVGILQP